MQKLLSFSLALIATTTPLAAQKFEGTVTVRMGGPGGTGAMLVKMTAKGDKILSVVAFPGQNQEVRSVTDNKAHTMTTFRPFPPGMGKPPGVADAKGVIQVTKLPTATAHPSPATKSDLRALGTSQVIAGFKCDDYELTGETGDVVRMCFTTALGAMAMGPVGGGQPAWAQALGNKPVMPLKVWTPNGNIILEVVSAKKQVVSPHEFDAPAGYIDMATALKNRTTVPPKKP